MEKEVDYASLVGENNAFERVRERRERGGGNFRPGVESIAINGSDYYYYLLRKQVMAEEGAPQSLVLKLISKDPVTGKRVMLLGLRAELPHSLRQEIAEAEIRAFKVRNKSS